MSLIDTSPAWPPGQRAAPDHGLVDWLVASALPTWARAGVDHRDGGFFEKIGIGDGRAVDEPRRTRVVARQIYVFATAARHGWLAGADALVDHGLRFLHDRLRLPDGSFAAAVRPDGTVVRAGFDLYEHAFVLFAWASACRGRPDRAALRAEALHLLHLLRRRWGHPAAGFEEAAPRSLPLKSNPHMHLLEAALAWSEVSDAEARSVWDALADELAELCLARFIDAETGALHEYFDGDWERAQGAAGQVVEPGHQFEWAWLLMRWGRSRGRADALTAAARLLDVGERHGVDAGRGVAVNELSADLSVADPNAKLWPQTERIKAWHAARNALDAAHAEAAPARVEHAANALKRFLMPADAGLSSSSSSGSLSSLFPGRSCGLSPGLSSGLWHEQMNADGGFALQDCRASSLYHIVCAIETLHGEPREGEPAGRVGAAAGSVA